jgi:cyclic pyranopterin phosphate synthase
MSHAAAERKRARLSCTLGMQMLLLPENGGEAATLARRAKEIGMDYLVIKPYSQHPQSKTTRYQSMEYKQWLPLSEELEKLNDAAFKVVLRIKTMQKWDEKEKPYDRCCSLPFWSYVDSSGTVWGCSVYLRDERFRYGNLFEQTYKEIWESAARKRNLEFVANELDPSRCRVNCRMDEVNRYLWELTHPKEHVNFI